MPARGDPTSRRGVVVVFGKSPRAGLVKTRMTPPLTPEQAAELYSHLLDDVLEATAAFARALDLEPMLALHPPEACSALAQRVPRELRVIAQRGVDLAERMSWAIEEAAAAGAQRILLRGSDSPVLSLACFEQALSALDDVDLVVVPDRDGGYSLIGLRAPRVGLFDHPMSTRTVLEETLANAGRLGLTSRVLDASFDLDTVADLSELARARAAGTTGLCPRTIAFLDAEQIWRLAGAG